MERCNAEEVSRSRAAGVGHVVLCGVVLLKGAMGMSSFTYNVRWRNKKQPCLTPFYLLVPARAWL